MGEVKRDPQSDMKICDGFKRNVDSNTAVENGVTVSDFTEVAFEALPHWIHRAEEAEKEVERLRGLLEECVDELETTRIELLNEQGNLDEDSRSFIYEETSRYRV
ncbi:hypothetical protein EMIT07CA2_30026 [Brevibacillus sp. IT-7CA2]|uniref:hypothetical protein n=1 Tax=Brevibacillus sp. IT-7CA2 TaxID=3026436 RepID=UPI0039DF5FF3